jgi:hypothetical protein
MGTTATLTHDHSDSGGRELDLDQTWDAIRSILSLSRNAWARKAVPDEDSASVAPPDAAKIAAALKTVAYEELLEPVTPELWSELNQIAPVPYDELEDYVRPYFEQVVEFYAEAADLGAGVIYRLN